MDRKSSTNFLSLSRQIAGSVKQILVDDLKENILKGVRHSGNQGSKSEHAVDTKANLEIVKLLEAIDCNLYLESHSPVVRQSPEFTIYAEPRRWFLELGPGRWRSVYKPGVHRGERCPKV